MTADLIWQAAVDLASLPRTDANRTALESSEVRPMLDDAVVLCGARVREMAARDMDDPHPGPLLRIYVGDAWLLLEDRDIEARVAWLARMGRLVAVRVLVPGFEELPERYLGFSTRSFLQDHAELEKSSA